MRSILKPLGLLLGLIAIIGGTMMLLGNVHSADQRTADLEFTKLESMAAVWESRLSGARATLAERALANHLLDIANAPGDWATWRAGQKYQTVMSDWNSAFGSPRGMALILGAHQLHSVAGDTSGLTAAIDLFSDKGDVLVLPGLYSERDGCIALRFTVQPTLPDQQIAHFIALVNRSTLLTVENAPAEWQLLAAPDDARFSNLNGGTRGPVSAATWPLLMQKNAGMVPGTSGGQWGFAKIALPGDQPLLLIGSLTNPNQQKRAASYLIIAGALALCAISLIPKKPQSAAVASQQATPASAPAPDANSYREIFQSIQDPLCLIESDGRVARANHSAQELLAIKKGLPDQARFFEHGELQVGAGEFLRQLAAYPKENSGPCRLVCGDTLLFSGSVTAGRLYADQYHHGPVLVHFHAETEAEQTVETVLPALQLDTENIDSNCPYPVLKVSTEGLIEQFNESARSVCPVLDSSPLIGDAISAYAGTEWANLIKYSDANDIETLFGGVSYRFRLVRQANSVLLYGTPVGDSKTLEISLEQSQAAFNALSNLTPAAVLLVSIHDQTILQCNMEACDVFSMPAPALVGNSLEQLAAFPWEVTQEPDQEYFALTSDGRTIRCAFACEVIKVDGEPTMLVVLDPISQLPAASDETLDDVFVNPPAPIVAPTPEPARGPGVLIVSNPVVRDVARKLLARFGHDCEAFTSLDDATIWLISHNLPPNFITLDLSDFDGAAEWLSDMRARYGNVPVIAITDGDEDDVAKAEDAYLLAKPFDLETVELALRELHVEPVEEVV